MQPGIHQRQKVEIKIESFYEGIKLISLLALYNRIQVYWSKKTRR